MKVALLVGDHMKPVPANVTVVENYGYVGVMSSEPIYKHGDHMIVEAPQEALVDWLKPFPAIWVTVGPLMAQEFEIMHIG